MDEHERWCKVVMSNKVLPDGRVLLPAEIVRDAGFEPGDEFTVESLGPRLVEIRGLRRLTLEEALDKYRIEGPIDEPADREAWQDEAAKDVFGS
jgi:antitoxin component of MazEF toxin-antitoxin module